MIGGNDVLKGHQVFKLVDGIQKSVRYLYMGIILLGVYYISRGYITGTVDWSVPAMKILTSIEMFLIVLYFGIKVSKQVFASVDGNLLGTEVNDILSYWEWLEDKLKEMLVYNGAVGFIMMSFYL